MPLKQQHKRDVSPQPDSRLLKGVCVGGWFVLLKGFHGDRERVSWTCKEEVMESVGTAAPFCPLAGLLRVLLRPRSRLPVPPRRWIRGVLKALTDR